ncbi:hypothetical protein BBP40_012140 [Aspergillus hancockii]|nr:hypothetical protein BBP40_012140 [Aspergillus hancockii]
MVIISDAGLYLCHFWQDPSIERKDKTRKYYHDPDMFDNDVLNALRDGNPHTEFGKASGIIFTPAREDSKEPMFLEQVSQIRKALENLPEIQVQTGTYRNVGERDPCLPDSNIDDSIIEMSTPRENS